MVKWAQQSMTWKGIHLLVKVSQQFYPKGISLTRQKMQEIENRVELPKWDILIRPAIG